MSPKGCSLPLLGEAMHYLPWGLMSPKGCSLPLLGEAMHILPLGTNEPQGTQSTPVVQGDAHYPLGVK